MLRAGEAGRCEVLTVRRLRVVLPVLGRLYVLLGMTMILPLIVSLFDDGRAAWDFVYSITVCVVVGFLLWLPFGRASEEDVTRRDGFVVATFAWVGAAVLGSLPYLFADVLGPVDAFFEAMSGFTTTGSTVINDVEALPAALVFWRAQTHWLGGLGIVVLAVAVLPFLGVAGFQLFAAEAPGLKSDRLRPRIGQTARMLWGVYVAVSVFEVVLLLIGGMNLLDAVCHTFATIATGGFSTLNTSVGGYGSLYIEVVVLCFMFLAGLPFALHARAWRKPSLYFSHRQFQVFAGIAIGATVLVTMDLWIHHTYGSLGEALRYGAFQVVSIMTTTGFASDNFEQWPDLTKLVLFGLMFVGGCAGSTGGSIKILRLIVLAKLVWRELYFLAHPRAVRPITLGGEMLGKDVLGGVANLFALYIGVFVFAAVALVAMGFDPVTALSTSAASIGNIGPGFGLIGPHDTYAWMPTGGKMLSAFLMLLGRLEIFTVAALLTPEFWRR